MMPAVGRGLRARHAACLLRLTQGKGNLGTQTIFSPLHKIPRTYRPHSCRVEPSFMPFRVLITPLASRSIVRRIMLGLRDRDANTSRSLSQLTSGATRAGGSVISHRPTHSALSLVRE
jgi:hypothetical protein